MKEREKTEQEVRQLRQTLKVATSEHEEHMTMDQFPKTQIKKGQVSLCLYCSFSGTCNIALQSRKCKAL